MPRSCRWTLARYEKRQSDVNSSWRESFNETTHQGACHTRSYSSAGRWWLLLPFNAGAATYPAWNFVNSTGVVTHFNEGQSKYVTKFTTVRALLADIGVGHIRDVAGNAAQLGRIKNLWSTLGIKLTALVDERTTTISPSQRLAPDAIAGVLAGLKTNLGVEAVEGLEGPNEYNRLERDYGYMGWPAELRAYQSRLYSLVNADPSLSSKMVIAPSIGGPKQDVFYSRLNSIPFEADQGSEHIYPNLVGFEQKANEVLYLAKAVAPGKRST